MKIQEKIMFLVKINSDYYNFEHLVSSSQVGVGIDLTFANGGTVFISLELWEKISAQLEVKIYVTEE